MSATKTIFKWFDITQHEDEQEYLREMHRSGWRLKKVTWAFYTFEQCEPEDVIYQLDYHQSIEQKTEYLQMFFDCGWEYIQDMMGYSYFRKPASEMGEHETGIFCDHESRMAMWDRVFKGRVRVLLFMLICVIIPQLVMQSHNTSPGGDVLYGVFIGLLLVYLVLLIRFARRYKKARDGE
ncbi:MAG: DUF2812 domain-containing protein [Oscillospiraceae bacterium]|nr:DUF2812 domain-containing protein [Oscillospiraceae bacterium]